MDQRILLLIILLATTVATCSTLHQSTKVPIRVDSKKVVIKGNDNQIFIQADSLIVDTIK